MKSKESWNRCDCCGKFISYADFASTETLCWLVFPQSDLSEETYGTLCKKCK